MKKYNISPEEVSCFLAGGITDCPNWQKEVIEELSKYEDTDTLVVFNPRRENFPIHDPNASAEQIAWEFEYLNKSDIFSMYFDGGESLQPICLYELGRHLTRNSVKVISVQDGYKRANDVIIQTKLATGIDVFQHSNPKEHAKEIYKAYKALADKKKKQAE